MHLNLKEMASMKRCVATALLFVGVFVFCVLAAWSGETAAAELPSPKVPDGLGINIHFTDPQPGEMDMLAAAGYRWVRMDFVWGAMESEKGVYDFGPWDRLMDTLEQYHMRPIFIFDYSNPNYDNDLSPCSDEGRAAFTKWAVAAAHHFRGKGIIWEMYNEPNLKTFWRPKPDVQEYIKLALTVGKALREAEPDELFVGPATSRIDVVFLEECFKAGLLEYWSAVTVHPYRYRDPETVAVEYDRLKQLIEKYAPQGKKIPILSAEWGFSSAWPNHDDVKQGRMMAREMLTNWANGIPLSIWYDWHDDGEDVKEYEHHFGTVYFPYDADQKPVYQPKPAYLAAQTFAQTLNGYQFKERLATPNASDYVLVFTKGNDVCWVAWTVSSLPSTVTIPTAPGQYQAVTHTGDVLPPVKANADGLSVVVGDAPIYLKPEPAK
jgi:hypothetical protein